MVLFSCVMSPFRNSKSLLLEQGNGVGRWLTVEQGVPLSENSVSGKICLPREALIDVCHRLKA